MVSSKQLRSQHAQVKLTPQGDQTRVKFDITLDTLAPYPGLLLKQAIDRLLRSQTDGLCRRMDSIKTGSANGGSATPAASSWYAGMSAMIVKELRELVRDRRTLAMLIIFPAAMLLLFGYAANFNVHKLNVQVMGPGAEQVAQFARSAGTALEVSRVDAAATRADAVMELRKAKADVVLVTSKSGPPVALLDGSALFTAQTAAAILHQVPGLKVEVLFNPDLKTSWWLAPSINGLILSFIGTMIASMGLVKERQDGTLEQLAVMPLRSVDVIIGKIAPYFLIAAVDVVIVTALAAVTFGVPFAGNFLVFVLASAVFLLAVLGVGVLISAVSRNQLQAVQTSLLVLIPQFMFAGFLFPLAAMPAQVRWVGYLLPLTYYTDISRGVILRDAPFSSLWPAILVLLVMTVLTVGAAILVYRRELAPAVKHPIRDYAISPTRSWYAGTWAMISKDFREVLRDRRTLAFLVILPVGGLLLFGYAAKFNVDKLNVEVMGPRAVQVAHSMAAPLDVSRVDAAATRADAVMELRKAKADVVVVTSASGPPVALIDGSALFTAQSALLMVQQVPGIKVEVLFNPGLETSWWLVPSMSGLIVSFIGTFITCMGLVKERQEGTMEQLAVMPFRPADVVIGKIAPYFLVAALDIVIVTVLGAVIFGVPFAGNVGVFVLASAIFLVAILGQGVLISAVSRNQFQAVQTALLVLIPPFMLAGFIFPLPAMPPGVRWIGYLMPLTYYTQISRAVMLRDAPFSSLWPAILVLLALAVLTVGAAILAYRRGLASDVKQRARQAADVEASMIFRGQHLSVKLGSAPLLTDVSLNVPPGAVTAVVGGDGAGKSTLLRCLVGEVLPDDGVVERPDNARVGYMPSSSGSWSDLTVDENIDFVAGVYGLSGEALAMRRQQLLSSTGLDQRGSRLARQLSGGMRRKLGFVLASLHRPQLLVLDEPSTGVDPVSRVELWRLIAEAAADGAAVVMSTTYLDEAERASSILVLDRGRAILQGSPDEVVASVPGRIVEVETPSHRSRAWKRGSAFREWLPDGSADSNQGVSLGPILNRLDEAIGPDAAAQLHHMHLLPDVPAGTNHGASVTPDLEDAIIVRMLGGKFSPQKDPSPPNPLPRAVIAVAGRPAQLVVAAGRSVFRLLTPVFESLPTRQRATPAELEDQPVRALAQNVTKTFGRFTAVDDVSLEVCAGEIVGLIGPNGAGKTTLIRMLLALSATSAGRVELFGATPSREGRHRLGYVPQGLGLYADLTVAENVQFIATSFGITPAEIQLSEELTAVEQRLVGEIGLGRQRQLAFACALGHRPDLLILDEPASGVDTLTRAHLWDTIREQAAAGVGVLIATHNMQEAQQCDRIVIMATGQVVASGALTDVISGQRAVEVHTHDWARVFSVLHQAGLPVTLAGRRVRVAQTTLVEVEQILKAARVQAHVTEVPATLEETLLSISNN